MASVLPASVLVTGASRAALGFAIATRPAAAGYDVTALARTAGPALDAAIVMSNGRIRFFRLRDLLRHRRHPGDGPAPKTEYRGIWGLVNNAEMGLDGLLANTHNSQIVLVIRLNVNGG